MNNDDETKRQFVKLLRDYAKNLEFAPELDEDVLKLYWNGLSEVQFSTLQTFFETYAQNETKFPRLATIRNHLGLNKTNSFNVDDEVKQICQRTLALLSKGGPAEVSRELREKEPVGYEAIGGHWGWYAIMSGNSKMPNELGLKHAVEVIVKQRRQEQAAFMLETSTQDENKSLLSAPH